MNSLDAAQMTPARTGLARTCLGFGIATAAIVLVGYIWANNTHTEAALGIAGLAAMAGAVLGLIALLLGLISLFISRPKWPAIVGIALTLITFALGLVYVFV